MNDEYTVCGATDLDVKTENVSSKIFASINLSLMAARAFALRPSSPTLESSEHCHLDPSWRDAYKIR